MAKRVINFIRLEHDQRVRDLLHHACAADWEYDQVRDRLAEMGVYMPSDQYDAYKTVLEIQMNLGIGYRQYEWKDDIVAPSEN